MDQNTGDLFVDYLVIINTRYIITALVTANNNLGENTGNSGIDIEGQFMKGKHRSVMTVVEFHRMANEIQ